MIHKCYYELFIIYDSFSWFYICEYFYYLNYLNNEMLLLFICSTCLFIAIYFPYLFIYLLWLSNRLVISCCSNYVNVLFIYY